MAAAENRPSGRIVPPDVLHVTAAPTLSPEPVRPCARNWISWFVSSVTVRGETCSATDKRSAAFVAVPDVGCSVGASGAVASPPQAASTRRKGRKVRETASLRASLKVYVIGLPFHRSPYSEVPTVPINPPPPLG